MKPLSIFKFKSLFETLESSFTPFVSAGRVNVSTAGWLVGLRYDKIPGLPKNWIQVK